MNIARFIELLRAGCVDPVHMARYHGGGKGSAPPAPDYTGAAQQQAQAGKENLTQQTWANRPTINTPFGQQSWQSGSSIDPATGQPVTSWTQNNTLSPDAQAALDSQQAIQQGRSSAAQTLLGQATGAFQEPFDWENMPKAPGSIEGAQQGAYEKMSAMLEPGRQQQRGQMETRLANMGLPMGSEAYNRAKQQQQDQFTQQDKTVQAQALGEGRADVQAQQGLRGSAIAEQAQKRGMTLNELNALLTGQQVSMPQMPGFQNAGMAQAPQLLDAASAAGNYGMGAAQFNRQGQPDIGSMVGTGLTVAGAAGMF